MHPLPGAIVPPAPAVLVDDLPGGNVMGPQAPGTATPEARENRIQDFALRILLRSPTGLGGGNSMVKQRPFAVTEISRGWCAGFHAPMLPDVAHSGQPF
jgi:hypothetical protein